MTAPNPAWVEAGARALLGTDRPCKRWGFMCFTHSTDYMQANFANQSEEECGNVHAARRHAADALTAALPLIREQIAADIAGLENDGCRRVPGGCTCHTSRALRQAVDVARGGAR